MRRAEFMTMLACVSAVAVVLTACSGPTTPSGSSSNTSTVSAPASVPRITALTYWNWAVGLELPVPGDNIYVGCTVFEADGAAMTITVTLAFDDAAPQQWTGTTAAGASSSTAGSHSASVGRSPGR